MDHTTFFTDSNMDNFTSKLSPVTSVGTEQEIDIQIYIDDSNEIQLQRHPSMKFNNKFYPQEFCSQYNIQTKQQLYQYVEDQIMLYFKRKGVDAGNPGDFKKQFNKKLHKRVSMMVEVNQKVAQKANAGSSLLQRRLQKKMTVTL